MSKELYEFACSLVGHERCTCKNCAYRVEKHEILFSPKKHIKVTHLCMRNPFGNGFEVDPDEFCDFFTPRPDLLRDMIEALNNKLKEKKNES